ncbi:MAG: CotH kinase family protein [Myxococcales bacterium]|nr:CotH kinase family protein [Myxococcales bacterium]
MNTPTRSPEWTYIGALLVGLATGCSDGSPASSAVSPGHDTTGTGTDSSTGSSNGAAHADRPDHSATTDAPTLEDPATVRGLPMAGSGAAEPQAAEPQTADPQTLPSAQEAAPAPVVEPEVEMEPEIERPEGWQEASHARGATPDYARLFADDRVHRIDITMSQESQQAMHDDLAMLLGEPGSFTGFPRRPARRPSGDSNGAGATDLVGGDPVYVPVTVRYDGGVWTQVGMRYKGNSSLAAAWRTGVLKIGFRLDFDRYEDEHPETLDQRFYGFGKMTFASGYRDPSLIRDKLASEILADQGLVAIKTAFYRVYVDAGSGPEYWGLYTMIEDPADQLVEVSFSDKSGNLYKPSGPGANFASFNMDGFVKKSNKMEADYSDVMAAIDALHAPRGDAQAWRAGLERVFDVDTFLGVLAFSRAIGHWDSYGIMPHNYYLYGDPSQGGRLVWISWDHNLTWGAFNFRSLSVMMDDIGDSWPLIRFLLDDPVYRQRFIEALRGTLTGAYEKSVFDARAGHLHAMIEPYVVGPDGEQAPYTLISDPNQFRDALSNPDTGLLAVAETLRNGVRLATGD